MELFRTSGQLISWLAMHKFAAHETARIISTMGQFMRGQERNSSTFIQVGKMFNLEDCQGTAEDLEKIGCNLSAAAFRRLVKDKNKSFLGSQLAARISEMASNLDVELSQNLFFFVPIHRAAWYSKTGRDILGDDCITHYPNADVGNEAEHAAKCFAYGEYTACAFHLMRVCEIGVRAFGIAIGFRNTDNPNWGKVFQFFDDQMAQNPAQRSPQWIANADFINDVAGHFKAVKNTWRNSTMHVDRTYTEQQAQDLLIVVGGFMKILSSRVDENGQFHC